MLGPNGKHCFCFSSLGTGTQILQGDQKHTDEIASIPAPPLHIAVPHLSMGHSEWASKEAFTAQRAANTTKQGFCHPFLGRHGAQPLRAHH